MNLTDNCDIATSYVWQKPVVVELGPVIYRAVRYEDVKEEAKLP